MACWRQTEDRSSSCHFASQHLSLSAVAASVCRLQTEQTRPCECVIRIVNEVNSSAHLTSLQLRLVQHHGTLRCYIMGNDWLQILHQSTRERKDWCFFLFMLILLLDLCLCWGQFYDQAGGIECKQTKIYPWKIKDPATGTCKKNIAAASTVLGASCFREMIESLGFVSKFLAIVLISNNTPYSPK